MTQDAGGDDPGRCTQCRGRIAATHMMTQTCPLDAQGRWQRRPEDFVEDVVVVCTSCGHEPEGRFEAHHGGFRFVPAPGPE